MTTDLQNTPESGVGEHRVDYSPNLVPNAGMTVVVRELSMLSHDGMGGYSIMCKILDAGASLLLAEYDIQILPDEPMRVAKLAGPCLAMMLIRDAEDRTNKTGRYAK